MALSNDLISQFVKATKDKDTSKKEATVYGTAVEYNGEIYVRVDGSEHLTPVSKTTNVNVGERVTVMIKNHTATVTGNLSSPSARTEDVEVIGDQVSDFDTILADCVRTEALDAQVARIDDLVAGSVDILGRLTATEADVDWLEVNKLDAETAELTYATIENLDAVNIEVEELQANYGEFTVVTSDRLTAVEAFINNLDIDGTLTVESLEGKFANIDFSNIGVAAIKTLYTTSGIIKDATISNGAVTGTLVGVRITGDLIEANTVVADKLVIKGTDGLYYKLNTDGMKTEAQQTDQNSLNGSIILAKSIAASKISVTDLVAFGATIGGFHIGDNSLYSGAKSAVGNTTRGIYLDTDGQANFGDANNFVKYYKDTDGTYKLAISAESFTFSTTNKTIADTINDVQANVNTVQNNLVTVQSNLSTVDTKATNAAKTATDYMNLSSAGLVVGQNPSSPTAGNTLISPDGVSIRKGTTILAEFKAASRTASGISSATLTSKDLTDSESDSTTQVSGSVTSGETRANVYITTNGNPIYFPKGLETDTVLINNSSGIIANCNLLLNGSLVDHSGEGIFTPLNSYGNTIIGYGRYQDGGGTYVYGTTVKAKTKSGFSASVNGIPAIDTNNSSGNATFGWHLYEASKGETNIYGNVTSLFSKDDIRLNANGNVVHLNGTIIPYTAATFDIGSGETSMRNLYISAVNTGTAHGLRFANDAGTAYNAVGMNSDGYLVYGNTTYCTNIVGRSTTTSNTGYSFKITCGDNPALTNVDDDGRLLLAGGTDATGRYVSSPAIYKRTYSFAGNVHITANGVLGRSTSSSKRYKRDISVASTDELSGLYELPVKKFKYNNDYISVDDDLYDKHLYGFIVEDLEDILPCAVQHTTDKTGEKVPEMWNSNIIIPALLKLIQDLNRRLKTIEQGA